MASAHEPYRTNRVWQTPQRRPPARIWVYENELLTSIRSGWQWASVERLCRTKPEHASLEDRDMMGNTSLHLACRMKPPLSAIVGLIQAEPRAVSSKNESGCTPLHLASFHQASSEVISRLLKADSEVVATLSNVERTPIHYACMSKSGLSLDSFRLLVDAATNSILASKDASGQDPLCLLFDAHKRMISRAASISDLTDPIVGYQGDFWEKVLMLTGPLRSSNLSRYVGFEMEIGSLAHTLLHHKNCPPELVYFAMVMHPCESEGQDIDGNLPLHVVCHQSHEKDKEANKAWQNIVGLLLQQYPKSASISNKAGKLPLELAMESGRKWAGEIEPIFHAHPVAIVRQEAINFTYFPRVMYLASTNREARGFNAMFEILRGKPDLFSVL
eukprot:CAMPEP_0185727806 /NCGR_PEP_ID=MMETSP1171-20130828/3393_1 /TAXON_ID=374046 /ORGANISM="Helicotheca tamensis, Strain CCMP826" /LENGTH=387 /DNA_ID=CAMNT_0028396441 /DNA_START=94 /DNA_END=1257 /DNA_ORIENTATION=+